MPILINPMDETPRSRGRAAPRLTSLEGRTIGLLDISKPGGNHFLNELASLLREKHGVRETVLFAKPTFAKPAPQSVIDEVLASGCHGLIEALAD